MAPPRQTCLVHSDDEEEEDKDETAEEDDMEQRNETADGLGMCAHSRNVHML